MASLALFWSRFLRLLYREAWHRSLPHGLISLRYVWPGNNVQVRLHRQLWWRGNAHWPRLLWFSLEFWLWLRWIIWRGPRFTWLALKNQFQQHPAEPVSFLKSYLQALKLTLGWCIAPRELALFGLYKQPGKALDYVYSQETPAYHALRNQAVRATAQSLRCIQNKTTLAELLDSVGVPMVPTVQCIAVHSDMPWETAVGQHQQVFCKMRSGNHGHGAFAAWKSDHGWQGQRFTGQPLPDTHAVQSAWHQLLKLDDTLLQPLLQNHPDLTHLAHDGRETITLRLITEWRQGQLMPMLPTLEVPIGKSTTGQTRYAIVAVDVQSGILQYQVLSMSDSATPDKAIQALLAQPAKERTLPCWSTLCVGSLTAHALFPDIQAVAWDWVITPNGPVLLEGNTGWSLATPQLMGADFLSRASCLRTTNG